VKLKESVPLRRFQRSDAAFLWLLLWSMLSIYASLFTEPSFRLERALHPPSGGQGLWFGADAFGRSLGWSVLRGSSLSLLFGFLAVIVSSLVATAFGILSAFAHKGIRLASQQMLEFLIGIPGLVLALGVAAVNGPGWTTLLIALILGVLPSLARIIQARTRELMLEDYVQASLALGATRSGVVRRHLLRGLTPILAAKMPTLFAHCLLAEATLSFLGVGAPLGNETWGALLAQGKEYLLEAPQIAWASGIPLVLTLLAVQTLADRTSNPRNRTSRG
jgi:peptide/nickel transport system permease protein